MIANNNRDATIEEIRAVMAEVLQTHAEIFRMLDEYDRTRKING
jgi:hypothetical protein